MVRARFPVGLVREFQGSYVAGTVDVHVGAPTGPDDIRNCPLVPALPPGFIAPENVKFPLISKFPGPAEALDVPMAREAE
jgi:hypothetical protein